MLIKNLIIYMITEVQDDLYSMSDWPEEWEIGFYTKKCKSMHMGGSNPRTVYFMKEGDKRVSIQKLLKRKIWE